MLIIKMIFMILTTIIHKNLNEIRNHAPLKTTLHGNIKHSPFCE